MNGILKFVVDNKSDLLWLAGLLLPTIITGLTKYPQATGIVGVLKVLLNLVSLTSHRDSPGTFKFPLMMSKPPDGSDPVDLPSAKGFFRLFVFILALASLPAMAQDATPPVNPTRLLGGCNGPGTICFGPSVSLTMTAWDLTHGQAVAGFAPGVGYGVTFFRGNWKECGVDYFIQMQTGTPSGIRQTLLAKFISGYLRVGISRDLLDGHKTWLVPIGTGFDIP